MCIYQDENDHKNMNEKKNYRIIKINTTRFYKKYRNK